MLVASGLCEITGSKCKYYDNMFATLHHITQLRIYWVILYMYHGFFIAANARKEESSMLQLVNNDI